MAVPASLRPATAADADFAYRVTERTMRGYVERTWGRFDEAAARENVVKMIATGTFAIIQRDGADVGILHVERDPGDFWLAQLFILPEHQNLGIGTHFLRAIQREAAEARKPLRLRVLTVNPALRLYEREGFTTFTTTFGRTYMQWRPDGLDLPTSAGDCPPEVRSALDACGITPDLIAERFLVVQPEARELELVAREESGREHRLVPSAARAWREMQAAAQGDGVPIRIVSAFRSVERQAEIIRAKVERGDAVKAILKVSAPPGYSEHHTGCALDVTTDGARPLEVEFEATPAFAWLRDNAGRFGFRMSYPPDNPYGYAYEPWHWHFARA